MPTKFKSGAVRSERKPRFALIPYRPLKRVADRYTMGAEHYAVDNWKIGFDDPEWKEQMINHMMEHLLKYKEGFEPNDDHLAAVAWGALGLMEYEEGKPIPSTRWLNGVHTKRQGRGSKRRA